MSRYNVAIVGVTGMVGQAFIKILQERKFRKGVETSGLLPLCR